MGIFYSKNIDTEISDTSSLRFGCSRVSVGYTLDGKMYVCLITPKTICVEVSSMYVITTSIEQDGSYKNEIVFEPGVPTHFEVSYDGKMSKVQVDFEKLVITETMMPNNKGRRYDLRSNDQQRQ